MSNSNSKLIFFEKKKDMVAQILEKSFDFSVRLDNLPYRISIVYFF